MLNICNYYPKPGDSPGDHQEENRQESERQSRDGTLLISKEAEETDTNATEEPQKCWAEGKDPHA